MTLNLEQIKEIIPHRDPFLLIDEVTELDPGVSVTAKKYLKPDEYWFKGHFPGQPGSARRADDRNAGSGGRGMRSVAP